MGALDDLPEPPTSALDDLPDPPAEASAGGDTNGVSLQKFDIAPAKPAQAPSDPSFLRGLGRGAVQSVNDIAGLPGRMMGEVANVVAPPYDPSDVATPGPRLVGRSIPRLGGARISSTPEAEVRGEAATETARDAAMTALSVHPATRLGMLAYGMGSGALNLARSRDREQAGEATGSLLTPLAIHQAVKRLPRLGVVPPVEERAPSALTNDFQPGGNTEAHRLREGFMSRTMAPEDVFTSRVMNEPGEVQAPGAAPTAAAPPPDVTPQDLAQSIRSNQAGAPAAPAAAPLPSLPTEAVAPAPASPAAPVSRGAAPAPRVPAALSYEPPMPERPQPPEAGLRNIRDYNQTRDLAQHYGTQERLALVNQEPPMIPSADEAPQDMFPKDKAKWSIDETYRRITHGVMASPADEMLVTKVRTKTASPEEMARFHTRPDLQVLARRIDRYYQQMVDERMVKVGSRDPFTHASTDYRNTRTLEDVHRNLDSTEAAYRAGNRKLPHLDVSSSGGSGQPRNTTPALQGVRAPLAEAMFRKFVEPEIQLEPQKRALNERNANEFLNREGPKGIEAAHVEANEMNEAIDHASQEQLGETMTEDIKHQRKINQDHAEALDAMKKAAAEGDVAKLKDVLETLKSKRADELARQQQLLDRYGDVLEHLETQQAGKGGRPATIPRMMAEDAGRSVAAHAGTAVAGSAGYLAGIHLSTQVKRGLRRAQGIRLRN